MIYIPNIGGAVVREYIVEPVLDFIFGDAEAQTESTDTGQCIPLDINIQVAPIIDPPEQPQEVSLSASRGFLNIILANTPNRPDLTTLSDEVIENTIGDMLEFMGQSRSTRFTRWIGQHMMADENAYLRDCLRLIILRNIAASQTDAEPAPVPEPMVPQTGLDRIAIQAAAEGVLDQQTLDEVMAGRLRLVTREINSEGQISGYSVRIQYGAHEETILEFREGRYFRGNPASREPRLDRNSLPGDAERQQEIWQALTRAFIIGANGRVLPAWSGRIEDLSAESLTINLSDEEKQAVLTALNELPRSPLARGLIVFAQRLMLSAGTLNQRHYGIREGHFCRETLSAFGVFTSSERLDVNFHLPSAQARLEQRTREVDRALQAYQNIVDEPPPGNEHVRNHLRYEAGQRALRKINMLVNLASSYRDIDRTDPNLSLEQVRFIERCDEVIQQYRREARDLLTRFFTPEVRQNQLRIRNSQRRAQIWQALIQANLVQEQADGSFINIAFVGAPAGFNRLLNGHLGNQPLNNRERRALYDLLSTKESMMSWRTITSQYRIRDRLQERADDDTAVEVYSRQLHAMDDRIASETIQFLNSLRQWRSLIDYNTTLANVISRQTRSIIALARTQIADFSDGADEENRRILQQLIAAVDERNTNEIAGERVHENIDPAGLRNRYDRALAISADLSRLPALNPDQSETDPPNDAQRNVAAARQDILSYINQFLLDGSLSELIIVLEHFRDAEDIEMASLTDYRVEITRSQTASGPEIRSAAHTDFGWWCNRNSISDRQRRQIMRLANARHSYNQGLPRTQHVSRTQFIQAMQAVINGLRVTDENRRTITEQEFLALARGTGEAREQEEQVLRRVWQHLRNDRDIERMIDRNGRVTQHFQGTLTIQQLRLSRFGLRDTTARQNMADRITRLLRSAVYVSHNEARRTLRVVTNTSDDWRTAPLDISDQFDKALHGITLRHNRRISGGRERVMSPQLVFRLARRSIENSATQGIVRGSDLEHMDNIDRLPDCIDPNAYYFVTPTMGFYRITGSNPTDSPEERQLFQPYQNGRPVQQREIIRLARGEGTQLLAQVRFLQGAWQRLTAGRDVGGLGVIDSNGLVSGDFRGVVTARDLGFDPEQEQGISLEEARDLASSISLRLRANQALPVITPSRDERTTYPRSPQDFVINEPAGSLWLAAKETLRRQAVRAGATAPPPPTPDNLDLMINGHVNCRLTGEGLSEVMQAFSTGTHWVVMPNRFMPTPAERGLLRTLAERLDHQNPEGERAGLGRALRQFIIGGNEIRLTDEERALLREWINEVNANPESLRQLVNETFSQPNQRGHRRNLASALTHLHIVVNHHLELKNGIPRIEDDENDQTREEARAALEMLHSVSATPDQINTAITTLTRLEDNPNFERGCMEVLLWYLSLDGNLSINNERLTSMTPDPEFIAQVEAAARRQNRPFNRNLFIRAYARSVATLRRCHRGLRTLASKFPPEERGWHGFLDSINHYLSEIRRQMPEGVATPSQAHFLSVGSSSDQNMQIKAILHPEQRERLNQINNEFEEFRARIDGNQQLRDSIRTCVTNSRELLTQRRELERIRDHVLRPNNSNPDVPRAISFTNSYLNILFQMEQANREPLSYLYNADSILERARNLQTQVARELPDAQAAPGHVARDDEVRRGIFEGRRDALDMINNGLTRIIRDLSHGTVREPGENPGVLTARDAALPDFEEKVALELERTTIMANLSSDQYNRAEWLRFRATFYHAYNMETFSEEFLEFISNSLASLQEEVTGPTGFTGMTPFEIVDLWFGIVNRHRLPGDSARQAALWTALTEADFVEQHAYVNGQDPTLISGNITFRGTRDELAAALNDRLDQDLTSEELDAIFNFLQRGEFDPEDRRLSINSTIPHVGEPDFQTLARIAMSQIMERLPREQIANVATGLPSLLMGSGLAFHGFFAPVRDIPSLASGLMGSAGQVTFGPTTEEDYIGFNNPLVRLSYRTASLMVSQHSSGMPMSPSIYMQLQQSRRPATQRFFASVYARPDHNTRFNAMTIEGVRHFYADAIVAAALPAAVSPHTRHRIDRHLKPTARVAHGSNRLISFISNFTVDPTSLPGENQIRQGRQGNIWRALVKAGFIDEYGIVLARYSGRPDCLDRVNDFLPDNQPLTDQERPTILQTLNQAHDAFNAHLEAHFPQGQLDQSRFENAIEDANVRAVFRQRLIDADFIDAQGNIRANFYGTFAEFRYVIQQYYPRDAELRTDLEASERAVFDALQAGREWVSIIDSMHTADPQLRRISEDMELASRAIQDLNATNARQDSKTHALGFFAPLETVMRFMHTHRNPLEEPLREMTCVHRTARPEQNGQVRLGFDLLRTPASWLGYDLEHGFALGLLFQDTITWAQLHVLGGNRDQFVDPATGRTINFEDPNCRRELNNEEFAWHAIRESVRMRLNLRFLMPRNISKEFTDAHYGLGQVGHGAWRWIQAENEDQLEIESAEYEMRRGAQGSLSAYALTTTNWLIMQAFSFIFGMDVGRKVEERNYAAAIGLLPPIIMMVMSNFRVPGQLARWAGNQAIASPEYVFRYASNRLRGRSRAEARAEAGRTYRHRMDVSAQHFHTASNGQIGIQMARIVHKGYQYAAEFPTRGLSDIYRLARGRINSQNSARPERYAPIRDAVLIYRASRRGLNSARGNATLEASPAQVQIRPLGDGEGAHASRTWLGRRWSRLRRYRTDGRLTRGWRSMSRAFNLPRTIGQYFTLSHLPLNRYRPQAPTGNTFATLTNFEAARANPAEVIDLTFNRDPRANEANANDPNRTPTGGEIKLRLSRQDILNLTRARADALQGNWLQRRFAFRRFRRIAYELGFRGNVHHLYSQFSDVAAQYNSDPNGRAHELAIREANPRTSSVRANTFDPVRFLEDASEGRGLERRFEVEVQGTKVTVTGRQILQMLNVRGIQAALPETPVDQRALAQIIEREPAVGETLNRFLERSADGNIRFRSEVDGVEIERAIREIPDRSIRNSVSTLYQQSKAGISQTVSQFISQHYANGQGIANRQQADMQHALRITTRRFLGEGRIARARRLWHRARNFFSRVTRTGTPISTPEPAPRSIVERGMRTARNAVRFFIGREVEVSPNRARTIARARGVTLVNLPERFQNVRYTDIDTFATRARAAGMTQVDFNNEPVTPERLNRMVEVQAETPTSRPQARPEAQPEPQPESQPNRRTNEGSGPKRLANANDLAALRPSQSPPPPPETPPTPEPEAAPEPPPAAEPEIRFNENAQELASREGIREALRARNVSSVFAHESMTPDQLNRILSRVPTTPVRGPRFQGQRPTSRAIIIGPEGTIYSVSMYEGMSIQEASGTYTFTDAEGNTVGRYQFNENGQLESTGERSNTRSARRLNQILENDLEPQIERAAREIRAVEAYRGAAEALAVRMNITPEQLRSLGIDGMMRNGLTLLGERLQPLEFLRRLSHPDAANFLQNTEEGRRFRRWMERGEGRSLLSQGPRAFMMGAITILGVEGLLLLFPGFNGWLHANPLARFALVLTLAHQGNATLDPLVARLLSSSGRADIAQHMRAFANLRRAATRGAARQFFMLRHGTTTLLRGTFTAGETSLANLLGRHIRNTWWGPGRSPTALGRLFRGLGSMYVASRLYDGLMSLIVSRDNVLRHHAVNFIASMGMPIGASALGRLAASLTARFAGRTAGAIVAGTATATGAAISGIGIGLMAIELYYAFSTNGYEASFHQRLVEEAQREGLLQGFDSARVTVFGPNACGSRILSAAIASQRTTRLPWLERQFINNGLGHLWNTLGGGTDNPRFHQWGSQILAIANRLRREDIARSREASQLLRAQLRSMRRPGESRVAFEARISRLLGQRVEFNSSQERAYLFVREALRQGSVEESRIEERYVRGQIRGGRAGDVSRDRLVRRVVPTGERPEISGLRDPILLGELRRRFGLSNEAEATRFLDQVEPRMLQDQFAYVQLISDNNLEDEIQAGLIDYSTRVARRRLQAEQDDGIDWEALATRAADQLDRFGIIEDEELLRYFDSYGNVLPERYLIPQREPLPEDRAAEERALTVDNPLAAMFNDHGVLNSGQLRSFGDWILDDGPNADPRVRVAHLVMEQERYRTLVVAANLEYRGIQPNISPEDRELYTRVQAAFERIVPEFQDRLSSPEDNEDNINRVVASLLRREALDSDQQYLAENGLIDPSNPTYVQVMVEATRLEYENLEDEASRRIFLTRLRLEYLQLSSLAMQEFNNNVAAPDENDPFALPANNNSPFLLTANNDRFVLSVQMLEACGDNLDWVDNADYVARLTQMSEALQNPSLNDEQRGNVAFSHMMQLALLDADPESAPEEAQVPLVFAPELELVSDPASV